MNFSAHETRAKEADSAPETAPNPSNVPSLDRPEYAEVLDEEIHEEYMKIKTLLLASRNTEQPIRSLVVAGSVRGEGASTVAIHIARTLAVGNAFPTLLVDTDLRIPSIHKYLGLKNDIGLAEVLSSSMDFAMAIHRTRFPSLGVVTAGRHPLDVSNLPNTQRYQDFLQFARNHFQYVILDAAPIRETFDAVVFGAPLDACVLVVRADHTPRPFVLQARQRLIEANLNVFGVVLNRKRKYVPNFIMRE